MNGSDPKWLVFLSKHMAWLAVHHISIILITLQVLGFLLIMSEPQWMNTLALFPDQAISGEPWRFLTFLSLPVSNSPIWFIFAMLFMYSILNSIESIWGSFKTTFYILVSVVITILFSLAFGYPVMQTTDFNSTLFLAAAALFPDHEIQVYMVFSSENEALGLANFGIFVLSCVPRRLDGSLLFIGNLFELSFVFWPNSRLSHSTVEAPQRLSLELSPLK
jgi:membrane associated rhomboid family serine protease